MCGIAGLFYKQQTLSADKAEVVLKNMNLAIQHRGPDAADYWFDFADGIGLGHRRLSIIDLSSTGAQPMESSCGRYIFSFNGEIYNYADFKNDLERRGTKFKGSSDTEVLLEAIATDGIEKTLQNVNGMFAFALWDKRDKKLFLARDKVGKKPLYFGWAGNSFLFSSELKPFHHHPDFEAETDYDVLSQFLKYHYVPVPHSIYKKVFKLQPGTFLCVDKSDIDNGTSVENLYSKRKKYWSAGSAVQTSLNNPFSGSLQDAEEELANLLTDATKKRLMSDVPLGALLSGGIDSSTVVALMQANSNFPVKTFSLGFEKSKVNEAEHAKLIAEHLGTDHTELYITGQDALNLIPALPSIYDEPFADSSQIPTYLISKLTRDHVTVALTGDGGDELFCGYRRYMRGAKIFDRLQKVPLPLRRAISELLKLTCNKNIAESRLVKFCDELPVQDPLEMYLHRISKWRRPDKVVLAGEDHYPEFCDEVKQLQINDPMHLMMFTDVISYLTDDILVKVDRASMAVSLEVRNPILDHRVLEFAFSLPLSFKTDYKIGKKILRNVLYRHVPQELVERPKQGFAPPVREWLSGPLNEWAEDLLSIERLKRETIFDVSLVRQLWDEFNSGKQRLHGHLWNVLMFQAWNDWQKQYRLDSSSK